MRRGGRVTPMESERTENKSSLADWREVVESVAAFATSGGGEVRIGIGPSGERTGVRLGKGTLEDLANKINQYRPLAVSFDSRRGPGELGGGDHPCIVKHNQTGLGIWATAQACWEDESACLAWRSTPDDGGNHLAHLGRDGVPGIST